MRLIIQPDDGVNPIVKAIRKARKTVDIVIFRFDRVEVEKALSTAIARGVLVRALIAHTNRGGEKSLRRLELRLLEAGVLVARTADDLPRYHGKMLLTDDRLHVYGFNYTRLDIDKSRSFGVSTRDRRLVQEGRRLFESDTTRQPYSPGHDRFIVSPESSREALSTFIKRAKKQLLIYDPKVSDNLILRLLQERQKAGVKIRIIGRLGRGAGSLEARRLGELRLHVRAIIRDSREAFIGSQSLRKLELDGRREVGIIVTESRIAKKIQAVFEADWAVSGRKKPEDAKEKDKDRAREKEKA